MKIELYINGEFYQKWYCDDIREDYTALGIQRSNEQINSMISTIKKELYLELPLFEYEFYIVYQSILNQLNFTDQDMAFVDRVFNKFKEAS